MYVSTIGEIHSHKLPGNEYYSFAAEELTNDQIRFGVFNGNETAPGEIAVDITQRNTALLAEKTDARDSVIKAIKSFAQSETISGAITIAGGKTFPCNEITMLKANSLHDMLVSNSGGIPKYLADVTGALVTVTVAEIEEYASLVETRLLAFQTAAVTKIGEVVALFSDPLKTATDISTYDITTGWPT